MRSVAANLLEEMPREMQREVVSRLDSPSALALALTSHIFFDEFAPDILPNLRSIRFSASMCFYGYRTQFEWLRSFHLFPLRWLHAYRAAEGGHLEMLKYIVEQSRLTPAPIILDSSISDAAAEIAHIPTLNYLVDEGVRFTTSTFEALGRSGSLEALLWAEERTHFLSRLRPNSFVYYLFLGAVQGGHLHILQYLTQNWSGAPAAVHLIEAVMKDQLHLLDWLYSKVSEYDGFKDVSGMLYRLCGHPNYANFVRFLIQKGAPLQPRREFEVAILLGNLEVAELIRSRYSFNMDEVSETAFEAAFEMRNIDAVKYLLSRNAILTKETALKYYVGRQGRFLDFLVDELKIYDRNEIPLADEIDDMRCDLVNEFVDRGFKFDSHALENALKAGFGMNLVEYLAQWKSIPVTLDAGKAIISTLLFLLNSYDDLNSGIGQHERYSLEDIRRFFATVTYDPCIPAALRAFAEENLNFTVSNLIVLFTIFSQ